MSMQDRATGAAQKLMLDIAGTRLAVTRRGQGPALVCLHAIGHGARDFDELAARLGDRLSIIAHDRFQELIDAANSSDSPIRMQSVVLDPNDLRVHPRTVVSQSNVASALGFQPANLSPTTEVAGITTITTPVSSLRLSEPNSTCPQEATLSASKPES